MESDIVIVGCGISGLTAAVSAMEAGANVTLLERSCKEDRGGNTRWTEATLRMKNVGEVADDFESHFAENAGHHLDPELIKASGSSYEDWGSIVKAHPFTDPELISTFSDEAGPTLEWLQTYGVRFDSMPGYFITTSTSRIVPLGGGLAVVETLADWIEKNGANIRYETTATSLYMDEGGMVCGIKARGPEGPLLIKAPKVILASGGFQGNYEMQARYIGPRSRYIRPVARGGYYDRGEGIEMALKVGAAGGGDFTSFHAEPIDPRSGAPEPIVLVFNYGILVNRQAKRFVDEAPASVDATYEAITREILEQPQGIAYTILDSKINDVPNWQRSVRTDQQPIMASSLEELAEKLELDVQALTDTVEAYNTACIEGPFDPLRPDGLRTEQGYLPSKRNWARSIDSPPFMAYPIICGNCFTFGGLKVNSKSEVLDGDGRPIQGLYGVGEVIGMYQGTYTGATSVLRGSVFGRIAGRNAASKSRR
ncbi:FAD-dependent oxidoreductase [Halomonas sp. QX-1]|uniref:FAD-dependent oxidoreductase n=2 Tax=Vreelandella maris TaxID=2729617 RepID=A0A7Y6V9V7_9GAMM|nr:FAD-dependent oxidoreductase [Halomonas maris]